MPLQSLEFSLLLSPVRLNPASRVLRYDRRSVGQSLLEESTHLGLTTRFLLPSDSCRFPFWREDGSVVYNCGWSSPAQSFSGPSRVGLVTIFYCLRFETFLFVASHNSQGYGRGIRPPRINYVSFHDPVRTTEKTNAWPVRLLLLFIRCHSNACSKTVVQQLPISRCQRNVLSEAPPSKQSYYGFQASCHNILTNRSKNQTIVVLNM
jgi:hypothetical protein